MYARIYWGTEHIDFHTLLSTMEEPVISQRTNNENKSPYSIILALNKKSYTLYKFIMLYD